MSEPPEEEKEKATVLNHIANVVLPSAHLAPWASVHKKRTIVALATLYAVSDIATEVDRRVWLDDNPEAVYHPEDTPQVKLAALVDWAKKTPAESVEPAKMQSVVKEMSDLAAVLDEQDEEEEKGPLFDQTRVRGANGMFGFCMRAIAQRIHDLAPSEGGLRTKQAIAWGGSMKSGLSIEAKPQTLWEKIRGKNKPDQQVST